MKYTVLQNLNYAAPYPGNLMASIFDLDRILSKREIETVYLFPKHAKDIAWIKNMEAAGKTVYFKTGSTWKNLRLFASIVKRHHVQILHTHFWNMADMFCVRLLSFRFGTLRTVLHHHNHYFESSSKVREKIKRWLLKTDVHVTCSDDVCAGLQALKFNNAISIENAIDFNRLKSVDMPLDMDLSQTFLLFGFDYFRKGVDTVLDAFHLLNRPDIKLGLVFAANEESGKQKIVERFGFIPEWLVILPPTENISAYYNACRAFISASREEGLCYSVMEATSCNCESIITDIPGHRTDIPEIKIFHCGNAEALALYINQVLDETPEERQRLNTLQREYVLAKYNLTQWSEKMYSLYKSLEPKR